MSVFSPSEFVERRNRTETFSGVGASRKSTIVITATTHANTTINRFHERFLGSELAASGLIASARILTTFFPGNLAALVVTLLSLSLAETSL